MVLRESTGQSRRRQPNAVSYSIKNGVKMVIRTRRWRHDLPRSIFSSSLLAAVLVGMEPGLMLFLAMQEGDWGGGAG